MQVLVLSRSRSFERHLGMALATDAELLFFSSVDDVAASTVSGVSAILIHSPSFNGEVETIVIRLNGLTSSSSAIGIAADRPTLEEMLRLSSLMGRAYFNSYMADIHYQQMLQFLISGQHWYVPGLLESALGIAKNTVSPVSTGVLTGLTQREQEIARVVSDGLNNKEIARKCGITVRTVKAHLSNIFEKSGVSDRVSLAILVKASIYNT